MKLVIEETVNNAVEVEKLQTIIDIADFDVGLRQMLEAEQSNTTTATGNIVLTDSDKVIQIIDPDGSDRDVTLPAESIDNHGYLLFNVGDGGEIITVKDDAGTEVSKLYAGGVGWFISNGVAWKSAGLGTTNVGTLRIVHWRIVPAEVLLATGDGKDFFTVPAQLNGYNLIAAHASVDIVSSSGTPIFQLHNVTDAVDMLSTRITIDATEFTSYTATAAPVIDTTKDDVATGDRIRADVDGAGTGTKGGTIIMVFQEA
jgi:hypothetical protein